MQFDDVDLMVIEVLLRVIRLIRKSEAGQNHRVLSLTLNSKDDGKHDFWIRGEEILENGESTQIGGKIRCIQGQERMWANCLIQGYVYLQGFDKCPFKSEHTPNNGLKILVCKDAKTGSYSYITVGEFEI